MRGGGFHNSLRGKGPSSLTRPVDKNNQQSSNNNENDKNNKNRFPPSSISPKKDPRGRDGSNWSSFQNSGASACEQGPESGPRTDMDSWDPLRDDFKNNKFSDRDFKRGSNSDPSVHVSQIPPEIDEGGLRNLFVDKLPHFKPTRVSVPPMKDGYTTKIGFVHYQTLDQCQEAIRLMSGHPLGTSYLRVHLGKKFLNMKQGGDNFRNGGDNFRNGKDTFRNGKDNFRNGGDNFRNARPGGDNFRNARPGGDNFRSRGSEMSPNQTNGRSPKGSVSSDSRRASPGIFSTRADVLNGGDQTSVKLSEPADIKFCAKCKMPATNACGPCEGLTFYCGSTCQMADWPAHQLICVASIGSKPSQQQKTKDIQQNSPFIPRAPNSPEPVKPLKMTSLPPISIPDSCKCLWVAGCSPLHFHVQLTDNQEVIENIIETMYSLCPEQPLPSRFKPQVGDVISALYNDGNWYRAEVLTTGEERIKVRMFDFATEDEVSVADIRPTSHLVTVMPQAVPCRLHDLLVPNEHSEQVMKFFSSHLQQSGSDLKLSKVDEVDGVFRVNLTLVSGEDLGDLMVANGHASRASGPKKNPYSSIDDKRDQIVPDKAYPANVSYITNLKEIYVSLLSNCTLLAELTDSLRGLVTDPSLAGGCFAVNDAVVALFEGMPGRGLVSALLPNKMIKVKFVDFGNFELFNAADLWKLSVEYLNFPQLAIKCRLDLDGVELAKEPETVVQYLKTEYPDVKEVRCTFLRKEEETHVIRLCTEGGEEEVSKLAAAGLVRSKGGPPPLSIPSGPPPLSKPSGPPLLTSFSNKRKVVYFKPSCVTLDVGATFSTAICNIENPTTIIANFLTPMQDKATEFLQHVQVGGEGIETFAASGTAPELDQLVLCFSEEFQEWFRARVKSAGGSSCGIYALDYGYEQDVTLDMVVPAEEKFNSFPSLAYHVRFQGAEKILSKLRDTVPKEDWEPILKLLLIQEPFESEIVAQDSLDVLIKPKFDFVGRLKELIKPIIEKRKSSWESASSTSTPPPPFNLPAASPSVTRPSGKTSGGPQYVQITVDEWENVLLTIERLKRAVRELGVDV